MVPLLHVDDSPAVLYRRRKILERAGFVVAEALSVALAREAFARERPDVLLLDIDLPDGNGFDFAHEIRTQAVASQRDVGIILISSYFTEARYRVQGLQSGADAYLSEPISDVELVASVSAVARRIEQLKAARRNEQLLDALFEYIPEGITVAEGPDTRITRVSRFGLALTGRPREELEAIAATDHPQRWAILKRDGVTPAQPQELPLTRAVTTGAVITDDEWVLRRADGERMTILCNAGPIRDGDGHVVGGVIAWRDITTRKDVEEALRRRTEELKLADQAKNDFLATVVHELRQPINAALAALAVMKARPDRESGERAREVVGRQLQQMSRITEDLLDATRIVRGQVPLRVGSHDLRDIVTGAADTVAPSAAAKGVKLTTSLPNLPVALSADASRLEQVLTNLLSNAVRHTPPAGHIEVLLEPSSTLATIRVRDDGEGIEAERLPHIFDLFVRGKSSQGLGIGLALVKGLVEAHNGTITARSEGPGRGAEFIVTLPLRSAEAP